MMEWLTILSFCILMFWGAGCASDCGCFTGCNYCTDSGGANITFVITGITTDPFCSDTAWCDPVNTTVATSVPAGSTDCGATADYIGNCMCDHQTVYRPVLSCVGTGGSADGVELFSGAFNAVGGNAEVRMILRFDLLTGSIGEIATFSYSFTGPINCDTTNGPNAMTRIQGSNDPICHGGSAAATIQIGP